MDSDFWTLTELGKNYFGVSSHEVGKTLKSAKLRTKDGKPTSTAIELGLVRKFEGPQPWIPLWKWHKEKVLPYLKHHGLEVIEVPQPGLDEKQAAGLETVGHEQAESEPELDGPFSVEPSGDADFKINCGDGTTAIWVLGEDNARTVAAALNREFGFGTGA